jgi:hypothetical protein
LKEPYLPKNVKVPLAQVKGMFRGTKEDLSEINLRLISPARRPPIGVS